MQTRETQLQQMLTQLRTRLLIMVATVGIALDEVCAALETGNLGRAGAVRDGDAAVNDLEDEIDELALAFLARHQPVAQDLRFAVAAVRIVIELERIGDEAVNIAERVVALHGTPPGYILDPIRPLMRRAQELYRRATTVFRESDGEAALNVCNGEDESAQLEIEALQAIVEHLHTGGEGDDVPQQAMHGILICRAFNRICRRSANIAEQTCFIAEGVNLKHRR